MLDVVLLFAVELAPLLVRVGEQPENKHNVNHHEDEAKEQKSGTIVVDERIVALLVDIHLRADR